MDGLIVAAVEQRRLLKLAYSAGDRIVEPHVYGLGSNGRNLLRCYQLAGESASRGHAGLKLLRAEGTATVEVLDVRFAPRAGYDPDDPSFYDVHASSEPAPKDSNLQNFLDLWSGADELSFVRASSLLGTDAIPERMMPVVLF